MDTEKIQNTDTTETSEDDEFIESLLKESNEGHTNEKDRTQKNRDAEEARKRRAASKKQQEELQKEENQKKVEEPKKEEPKKEEPKVEEKKVEEKKPEEDSVAKLGKQLTDFKSKFPEVDLEELDKDNSFKRFIDGKLLGKKDFAELYNEYIQLRSEISGVEVATIQKNYRKANSSSGSSVGGTDAVGEVYSEDELRKVSQKLPFMSIKEAAKVEEKIKRSIAFYEKK